MLYLYLSYFLEGKLAVVETFWRDTIKSLNAFQRHQAIDNEMTTQLSKTKIPPAPREYCWDENFQKSAF